MASAASAQETFLGQLEFSLNGPRTNLQDDTSGELGLFMNFTEEPLNEVGPAIFSEEITADLQFSNSYTGAELDAALSEIAASKSPYFGLRFGIEGSSTGQQIPYTSVLDASDTITRIEWQGDVSNVSFGSEVNFDAVSTVSFYGIVPEPASASLMAGCLLFLDLLRLQCQRCFEA